MQKEQLKNSFIWSAVALIVPALGQTFVDGWNWGIGDFVFAWVFFNALGLTYTFVTNKISNIKLRYASGTLIVALFAFIWVMLATG